jgi:hypothetical protein
MLAGRDGGNCSNAQDCTRRIHLMTRSAVIIGATYRESPVQRDIASMPDW